MRGNGGGGKVGKQEEDILKIVFRNETKLNENVI